MMVNLKIVYFQNVELPTTDYGKVLSKSVLPNHNFNHLQHTGKGGLGKEAYNRVINGESIERNNDVYKAISYALQCNVDIEPLKVIIGDVKANGDEFTFEEWEASYNSARNSLRI